MFTLLVMPLYVWVWSHVVSLASVNYLLLWISFSMVCRFLDILIHHTGVHFSKSTLLWCLFKKNWSSWHYVYAKKCYNGNIPLSSHLIMSFTSWLSYFIANWRSNTIDGVKQVCCMPSLLASVQYFGKERGFWQKELITKFNFGWTYL